MPKTQTTVADEVRTFVARYDETHAEMDARLRDLETRANRPAAAASDVDDETRANRPGIGGGQTVVNEVTGALARTVPPSASIRSFNGKPESTEDGAGVTVGAIVRAMATGKATADVRAALHEGTDSAGGYAVPEKYSTQIIDLARSRTVVIEAGAQTVPVDGEQEHYLRVLSDPTPAWREELGTVTESEPTFGRMTFTPRSLAVIVRASRELLEDSPNADDAINLTIAKAFAAEMDRVGLFGSGVAPEPEGITNTTGIHGVASGAIGSYAPILGARRAILAANNDEPTAVVMNPTMDETFAGLADTTGQPLRPPRAIEDLKFLHTTRGGVALDNIAIVGDFTQLWYGIRKDLRIEPFRDIYMKTMEIAFLAHMRFDVAVVRPDAFAVITVTP